MSISALDAYHLETEDNVNRGVYEDCVSGATYDEATGKVSRFSDTNIAIYDTDGDLVEDIVKHQGPFFDSRGRMLKTSHYKREGQQDGSIYQRPLEFVIGDLSKGLRQVSAGISELQDDYYNVSKEEIKDALDNLREMQSWLDNILEDTAYPL